MVGSDLFVCSLEKAVKDKAIDAERQQENHRMREPV